MTRPSCLLPLIVFVLGLAAGSLPAAAEERILAFDSQVQVNADGSLQVAETIQVRAEGDQIKRGIYRDFPTRYTDSQGRSVEVEFSVESVERDGAEEAYFTQSESNGIRVYMGKKEVLLPPGEYTYRLTFRTDRQLGFFPDHDELYWNATGNGWAFPIDAATCTVRLPDDIPAESIRGEGYIGPQGSKEQAVQVDLEERTLRFASLRPLQRREGLTVVAAWAKGYVPTPAPGSSAAPAAGKPAAWQGLEGVALLMQDIPGSYSMSWRDLARAVARLSAFSQPVNTPGLRAGAAGLALLLFYYLAAWALKGRDPRKGVIVPLFEPPDKLSPAAVRYLVRMGYDKDCLTAAVLNLAVKGAVIIEKTGGEFVLHNTEQKVPLPAEEQALRERLFWGGGTLVLENSNHELMAKAKSEVEEKLKQAFFGRYFLRNTLYLFPGILIAVLTLLAAAAWPFFAPPEPGQSAVRTLITGPGIFLLVWTSGWTVGVVMLLREVVNRWRQFIGARTLSALVGAGFITLFSLPFIAGEVFGLVSLTLESSVWLMGLFLSMILMTLLFSHLLKAPTVLGRAVLDRIEGFKQYLSLAEADRLERLHPVAKTPALFEKYLPYALALEVENQWARQFGEVLEKAGKAEDGAYYPAWYRGGGYTRQAFASAFGSALSSAISSASTAPGSSSGSGGGGSSGGGGGGGGGGGW